MKKLLTIFTPTYNRANTLPLLYKSLQNQKCEDFEWLIIDDGSVDKTNELIEEWQKSARFPIRYYHQSNKGKMQAHNAGVELTTTPLFLCVDSDDYISDNCISIIADNYKYIKDNKNVAGMIAYKFISNNLKQYQFPEKVFSSLHKLYESGFSGDTTLIFKTDVIRQYKFKLFENEKFITEAYVYDQIDQTFKYFLISQYLTVCQYRNDGYTTNEHSIKMKYPVGWSEYYLQLYRLYGCSYIKRIKYMSYYIAFCIQAKKNFYLIAKHSHAFLFSIISFPTGLFAFYRFKKNNENR